MDVAAKKKPAPALRIRCSPWRFFLARETRGHSALCARGFGGYAPRMTPRSFLAVAALAAFSTVALQAAPLAPAIQNDLVISEGKKLAPFDGAPLAKAKYIAVYFSASWCGPCKAFTPELVDFYKKTKAKHDDFELVFVSRDRSENDMAAYMAEDKMKWPALNFAKAKSSNPLSGYAGPGIPCLVFLDAEGKVLSDSYEGKNYVGPQKVLADIEKTLRKAGSTAAARGSSFDEAFKKKPQP